MAQFGVPPQEFAFGYGLGGLAGIPVYEPSAEFAWELSSNAYRDDMQLHTPLVGMGAEVCYDVDEATLMNILSTGDHSVTGDWNVLEVPANQSSLIDPTWSFLEAPDNLSVNLDHVEDIKPNLKGVDVDESSMPEKAESSVASPPSPPSSPEWKPSERSCRPRASNPRRRAGQKRLASDLLDGGSQEEDSSPAPLAKKRMPRKRLYELGEFSDPVLERCRQNAINAKRHRDRRQKNEAELSGEMSALRESNRQLKDDNARLLATADLDLRRVDAIANALRRHGLEHLLSAEEGAGQSSASVNCGRPHKTARARSAGSSTIGHK